MVRACNEEATIGESLESLRGVSFPHEINVILNNCTDKTKDIVLEKQNSGLPIRIFEYNCELSRAGIENVITPVDSKHSAVHFANWCLTKGNYNYTFRWDADFVMSSVLLTELSHIDFGECLNYRICASNNEMNNCEVYLFCNSYFPRFRRYQFWESLIYNGAGSYNRIQTKMLSGTIFHKSKLKEKKTYWSRPPWWKSHDTETQDQYDLKYQNVVNSLGSNQLAMCRSSDEELNFRNIDNIFGWNGMFKNAECDLETVTPTISIVMMSRNRPDKLNRFLDSLENTCKSAASFEVLIRMDDDDRTFKLVNTNRTFPCRIWIGPRGNGYLSSTEFITNLTKDALGTIYWTLNDDLVCKTHNWDQIIIDKVEQYEDKIVCLYPDHTTHSNNCFPAWTLRWQKMTGHIAPLNWPHIDSWLSSVAKEIGREIKVPIFLEHDVVHGPTDITYLEGSFNRKNLDLGNTYLLSDNDQRKGDIEKLRQFIKS